ncbi:NAD-dependent malic enzyme [Oenococcus oeni]|uniref:Malolactic enzyme n=1 Tax=Oenococcus oeni TaxID=1247 RepID=A0A6N3ZZN0_OENOE|nr:malolactic enzyme [Oenococcus oeni]MDV7686576.1 oxaloacetate-decarboxylating malate dehydrogenase [Oenococcus oeni]OIK56365.1 NAD-dependent malic enzyme [Oenococcus oeni]OIL37560.1 NAD-dependent malic enzyme [Oenococcus oeni]OIM20621.1 NAD-dependent malic enzyme [Oenococcus oeni]OIM22739.1 NAD-dependent malic enzyme [Oenococcus oeni]
MTDPVSILNDPFINKGTAFTEAEREELGLNGLLPAKVQTLQEQVDQTYAQFQSKVSNLEKRLFLMEIFNTNHVLFYKLFSQHVVEFMPIVYDPTIADTIENYSELFVEPQGAAFLDINHPENIQSTLKNAANGRDIKLLVVSDAEGILGIGDWGVQGVDIAVGKLMVYTVAAGIDPSTVLPVVIDAGTNNEKLLKDPMYLGNKFNRVRGDKYYDFIDKFVNQAESLFPNLYLHWEDFGRSNASNILNSYKDKIATFNDDIQGTGIVVLAGVLGALKISGQKLTDQTYMSFGAGTAGMGIVKQLHEEMVEQGLSDEEAKKHFFLVDKQGLLFDDDPDLTPEQKPFAAKRSDFKNANQLTNLQAAVEAVHPTILVGTSTHPNSFTEEIVKDMSGYTERPIIFPISNPTKLAEAKAEDVLKWSKGKALIGTGVPVDDIEYEGNTYQIGQANNALIYPGLGFGAIAAQSKLLTPEMISAAAHSLGGIVDTTKVGAAVLPPVSKLADFSRTVAVAVAKKAVEQGLNRQPIDDVEKAVDDLKWEPKY